MRHFSLTLFILLFSVSSFAKNGKIIFSKDDIWINNSKAMMGSSINFGYTIKTGKKTTAIIKIFPSTSLKLKPNTEILIEKPTTNSDIETQSYTLKLGEMFIQANKTNKKAYQVKSNNVTFGVRGTQFFVSNSKAKKSWMCVNEGIVAVSIAGTEKNLEVKAGQGVQIVSNKLPKVKEYLWTKKLNWKMSGSIDEIKDTVDLKTLNYNIEELDYE